MGKSDKREAATAEKRGHAHTQCPHAKAFKEASERTSTAQRMVTALQIRIVLDFFFLRKEMESIFFTRIQKKALKQSSGLGPG